MKKKPAVKHQALRPKKKGPIDDPPLDALMDGMEEAEEEEEEPGVEPATEKKVLIGIVSSVEILFVAVMCVRLKRGHEIIMTCGEGVLLVRINCS